MKARPWPAPSAPPESPPPLRSEGRTDGSDRHLGRHHRLCGCRLCGDGRLRSEEHTSELQSLMRISYAVFCLKKKIKSTRINSIHNMYTNSTDRCSYLTS